MHFVNFSGQTVQAVKDLSKEERSVITQNSVKGQAEKTEVSDAAPASHKVDSTVVSPASRGSLGGIEKGRGSPVPFEEDFLLSLALEETKEPAGEPNPPGKTVSQSIQDVNCNDLVLSLSTSSVKFGSGDGGSSTSLKTEADLVGSGDLAHRSDLVCSQNSLNSKSQVSRNDSGIEEMPGNTKGPPTPEAMALPVAAGAESTQGDDQPSVDSLPDVSLEKPFSEEPVTESLSTATVPTEQALAEKDSQRGSAKRRKKKRHSKSHSSKLF